jgi:hypothetical protein
LVLQPVAQSLYQLSYFIKSKYIALNAVLHHHRIIFVLGEPGFNFWQWDCELFSLPDVKMDLEADGRLTNYL